MQDIGIIISLYRNHLVHKRYKACQVGDSKKTKATIDWELEAKIKLKSFNRSTLNSAINETGEK